jgi:hypothetical protein
MAFRGPNDPPIVRNHHGIKRDRSVGTRLTESEYQRLIHACGGMPPSEWVRGVLLARLDGQPPEHLVRLTAEVLDVRRLILNGRKQLTVDPAIKHRDAKLVLTGKPMPYGDSE